MSTTPLLGINEIAENEETGYVTFNEAVRILETAGCSTVISQGDTSPPGGESDGDAYLTGSGCTDAFANHDYELAIFVSTGYVFAEIPVGTPFWVQDEELYYRFVDESTGYVVTHEFLGLSDVSDTAYTGKAGYAPRVSTDVSGLELAAVAYDIPFWISGQPDAGEEVHRQVLTRTVYWGTELAGSYGKAGTASADSDPAVFDLLVNGVSKGSITFNQSATATFDLDDDTMTLSPGDVVTVEAPDPQDSALADIAITLHGRRTFVEED